jgi:hypothetical protein
MPRILVDMRQKLNIDDLYDRFIEASKLAAGAPSGEPILRQCLQVAELLLEKNKAYGDSALQPMRAFSKAPPTEQIRVRLDDKLSRLVRGSNAGEDVEMDLMGYIILLRIARQMEEAQAR